VLELLLGGSPPGGTPINWPTRPLRGRVTSSTGAALQRWVEDEGRRARSRSASATAWRHSSSAQASWNAPRTLRTWRSIRTKAPGSPIAGFRCSRRQASPRWSRWCRWSRRHEEVSREDDQHSWVVLRTPRSTDSRPFDHYVDFW